MNGTTEQPFNTVHFLAIEETERRIVAVKAKGVAFSQGTPADSVLYLQTGPGKTYCDFKISASWHNQRSASKNLSPFDTSQPRVINLTIKNNSQ